MIKRRLYKQDHADKDDVSDSSSSSSSDSDSESDPQEQDEEVDIEAVTEPKDEQPSSPSPGSGYESGDSSGNEVACDPTGLLTNDDDEGMKNGRRNLNDSPLTGKGNAVETRSNILAKKVSAPDGFADCVLKCKSAFKCRLCPRIVCLTEDTLRAHLESKRHARSKKLLSEGRLKIMLNSDGEMEEDPETHAERHARTIALTQDLTNTKKKNRGRQRQKLRLKRKTMGDGPDKGAKTKQTTKNPPKKRRGNED